MPTGSGVVGTAYRYFFALRLGNGAPRTGAAAAVTPAVRNPGNTATDVPVVTEVGSGQYFIDISAAFTTTHGAGQYGVLLEVTSAPRDTFSESVTFETVGPAGIPGLVWDELTAAHVVPGSFGLLVGTNLDATVSSRATVAGVWGEPLPGAFGAGTAGFNLDAPISLVPAATDVVLSAAHGAGSWLSAVPPTVAAIVAGVWGEPLPGAFLAGSAGFNLDVPVSSRPTLAAIVAGVWGEPLGLGLFGAGEAGTMVFELYAIRGLQTGAPADWDTAAITVPAAGVAMTIADVGTAKRITR